MHVCPRQTDHRRGACQQREMTTSLRAKKSVHACTCKILQINKKYDKYAASAGCTNGKSFSASGGFVPLTPHWGICPLDPRWGLRPKTPVIGSRYRARHSRLSTHYKFRSNAPVGSVYSPRASIGCGTCNAIVYDALRSACDSQSCSGCLSV